MSVSFLMVLVLVIAMGMGLALLLLARCSGGIDPLPDSKTLKTEIERLGHYRKIRRQDCEDAAERRRLMRRQLIDLRHDFIHFWKVCRLLAPYTQDPDFGKTLVAQFVTFHRFWVPLWIGTYGWAFERTLDNFTRVVDSAELLRDCAQEVVEGAERAAFESPAV